MNVYEDKYLRDKISRIIARQKEGKVVIAAYKDGSGLPAREDLGQALARAAYPYDYAVGNSAFLNYDSELGAYLYIAKPGVRIEDGRFLWTHRWGTITPGAARIRRGEKTHNSLTGIYGKRTMQKMTLRAKLPRGNWTISCASTLNLRNLLI